VKIAKKKNKREISEAVETKTDNLLKHSHFKYIASAAVLSKIAIVVLTIFVMKSFFDTFDMSYYYNSTQSLFNGGIPYINFPVDYPIMAFVPMMLAFGISKLFASVDIFILAFSLLMVICDILIAISIYLIVMKIWNNRHRALIASLLYTCAFASGYLVVTKFDAFPTCIMMWALVFVFYRDLIVSKFSMYSSYFIISIGVFTKIFPLVILPFMILYQSKRSSFKSEFITFLKIFIPVVTVAFIPFFILNPTDTLKPYLLASGSSVGVYASTFTFTLYSWLHNIFGLNIDINILSTLMYIILGLVGLILLYVTYKSKEQNPALLCKVVLTMIVALVICSKFHSPQYIIWFTPLMCIFALDKLESIISFIIFQVMVFIEFPLAFGKFYVNLNYLGAFPSAQWQIALVIFTIEYIALIYCLYTIVNPIEMLKEAGVLK
jgi:hypothetical protein